jgi:hypothetical protein
MTKAVEQAVRDAAEKLDAAIKDAQAAGYRVTWPVRAADLPAIAVSSTRRAETAGPVPAEPEAPKAAKAKA